jgi:putative ABC transport system permease protein
MDRAEAVHKSLTIRYLAEDGWSAFIRGEGGFVSERLYLLNQLTPGSVFLLGRDKLPLRVLGVYYDYGNPKGQVMLDRALFERHWPEVEPAAVGIRLRRGADKSAFWQQALEQNDLSESQMIDQQQMKQIALNVFEQTFVVTHTLNLLTLLVAAIGLMCALLLLGGRRCTDMAILNSMGVSRRTLFKVSLLQWCGVGLLLALLSLPFGIALAWVLINLLNVYGFGWSYPVSLQPQSYLHLILASGLVTLLAALVPLGKQHKQSLAKQLSEEP